MAAQRNVGLHFFELVIELYQQNTGGLYGIV